MLKSFKLQGGFAPLTRGSALDPAGAPQCLYSVPRPPLYIKHGASQLYLGGGAPTVAPAMVCGAVNRLGIYSLTNHQGQLSLPSIRGRLIGYRPAWQGLRRSQWRSDGGAGRTGRKNADNLKK